MTEVRDERQADLSSLPPLLRPLAPLLWGAASIRASVRVKALAGTFGAAVLLIAMGVLSLFSISDMSSHVNNIVLQHRKVDTAEQMLYDITVQMHYRAMALIANDTIANAAIPARKSDFLKKLALEKRLSSASDGAFFARVLADDQTFNSASRRVEALYRRHQIRAALRLHLALEHPLSHVLEGEMRQLIAASNAQLADADAAFQSGTQRVTTIVLIFALITVLVALILGSVLAWTFTLPVRKIQGALVRIAAGDFTTRVSVPNRDEFGQLSAKLNETTERLADAHRQLAEARDEALVANQAKSAFLAGMSHELRTPLNAIIGYSEMLIEDAQDSGESGWVGDLGKIRSAGRYLLDLINGLLDLSKIESGKMDLYLEDFGIQPLVDDVVATIQPLVEKNGNTLVIKGVKGSGSIRGDLTKTRQVLFNLLSNACKFTDHGTVTLSLRQSSKDRVEFTVTDTGIGMSSEQMSRLFQEFSQADASTQRKYGGTGLGLALSRRLAHLMGGEISVESELGKGSRFNFWLPTRSVEPPADGVHGVEGGPLILVIDDDPNVQDLLQRILGKRGYRVVVAGTGAQGIQLARTLQPSAVTLDVLMPRQDGWEILSSLKADPATRDIPVVMVTVADDRAKGMALGAVDYLTKPVDGPRLLSVISRWAAKDGVRSVLVVDDDPGTRRMLRQMLEREGWHVTEAADGQEALDRVAAAHPSVILLDLVMPTMDGFTFVVALRSRDDWANVPVVVLTSKDITADERSRLNGQVVNVLRKDPEDMESVVAEIGRVARVVAEPTRTAQATGAHQR